RPDARDPAGAAPAAQRSQRLVWGPRTSRRGGRRPERCVARVLWFFSETLPGKQRFSLWPANDNPVQKRGQPIEETCSGLAARFRQTFWDRQGIQGIANSLSLNRRGTLMADTVDTELAASLKQAKRAPQRFAFVAKSPTENKLLVAKNAIPKK